MRVMKSGRRTLCFVFLVIYVCYDSHFTLKNGKHTRIRGQSNTRSYLLYNAGLYWAENREFHRFGFALRNQLRSGICIGTLIDQHILGERTSPFSTLRMRWMLLSRKTLALE